ncbi:MAG: hypothetical protein JW832_05910 [Deltaproteobacteria bacterium]|nr:hypothetical protein [Deltaproteobacteria bacterium]
MNMFAKRCACVSAALLFILLAAPRSAEAMRFEYAASQDGFQCKYLMPFFGFGRVDLTGPDDEPEDIALRFLFIKFATVQLSIASINPDAQPPNLMLRYDITSRFSSVPLSGALPVAFGDGGLRIKLFRPWFLWTKGNDADLRLLLTRKKTKALFEFDLPKLQGTWADEANSQDNQIHQSITNNDNETLADIDMTFTYLPAFFTKVTYAITVMPDPVGAPDNSSSFDGNLVLPNGSYHAWFNAEP